MSTKSTPISNKKSITTARRIGRFFGYLSIFIVWLVIFGITLALIAALPIAFSSGGPLSAKPGIITMLHDPYAQILPLLIVGPLVSIVFGCFVLYLLPTMALSSLILAAVCVVKSLNPRYKDEPLSTSRLVDGAIDPRFAVMGSSNISPVFMVGKGLALADVVAGNKPAKTAASLLPVRPGRFSNFLGERIIKGLDL